MNDLTQIIRTESFAKEKPNGALQLSPIEVDDNYCKKWNESLTDFVVLTRNGELVNNTLYRVGGIGKKPDGKNYFMLIKHVEAFYPKRIMEMSKGSGNPDPKHLEGRWCILDKNGIEKVEFKAFDSPYLVNDSCIYSIDSKYYNIETGEFYCDCSHSVASKDFLFLENHYDKDVSKCGVMKINKKDGTWELFPD